MLKQTLVFSTLSLLAWSEDYLIYCNEDQPGPCVSRLSQSCYDCIHHIEAGCSGDSLDKQFLDCFCPIPSASWSKIEQCFNDPATSCNDGETGSTSETFALLQTFEVWCHEYNDAFLCNPSSKLDNVEKLVLSYADCNAAPA